MGRVSRYTSFEHRSTIRRLALAGILAVGLLCSAGLSYAYARVMLRPAAELRKLADARSLETRRPTEHTGIREFDTVLGMLSEVFFRFGGP